jgi:pyruvate dehydrogenase E1 component beta subunit
LAAAEELAREGIDCRSRRSAHAGPLDTATIVDSVSRTHRAAIIDEGWKTGSISAEIMARIMENAFYDLTRRWRGCSVEVPMPYPKHLEDAAIPQVRQSAAARRVVTGRE